jgi:hypothetical protein
VTFKELAAKKVFGVPVLYLALAAVVILAIVAYKMQPAKTDEVKGDPSADGSLEGAADDETTDAYAGLASGGTVTVVQQPTTPEATEVTIQTNETWVKRGAEWLVAGGYSTGPAALSALTKYVQGTDRSYDEQQLVDRVFKQFGAPPDSISEGGTVGAKPAQKQFPNLPGVHTITGNSDNGYPQLAALYYGSSSADRQDLIQAANTNLGLSGPWPVGTKVNIPEMKNIRYYTTPVAEHKNTVASKNALTRSQLDALNNGNTWDKYGATVPKGVRVRVL